MLEVWISCRRCSKTPGSCNACGGAVDVMTIQKQLDDGRSVPTKIGACLRCGKWFNEAGLAELARRPGASGPHLD